ncbi:MAG TPA: FAD-linked oxidase C-terminal domain-containing protein [Trueperaceae bacterium]|nr:FAD-linked oxidase C-terminal domain-containing protein [Trueperaceae bacterium]
MPQAPHADPSDTQAPARPLRSPLPPPRAVDDPEALERDLRAVVRGEVRFDAKSRALYATDASPYRIAPIGVVVPLDEEDVRAAVGVAARHGAPILPRGGGTSLAGQTVGEALVIDVSKHLTRVLEVNVEERWVRVQPGVVRDQLNRLLAPHGLQFTPDVATTDRANVGGMVANNSSGTHSIKYGKTVDQVMAMRVLLADGTELELGPLNHAELAAKLADQGREGRLYREVVRVVRENEDEIAARYPKVMRRVGGYNLDELVGDGPFNLAKLVCGSEGTLALILEVKLALHRLPPKRVLDMRHFDTLEKCLTAVQYINRHGPAAVELLDRDLFTLGKENPHMAPLTSWVQGDPAAVLLVEFDGETDEELERQLASLAADPEVNALSYASYVARHPAEQRDIVELRRAGLGIYATMKGRRKPTPFIEDAAIPVDKLPFYIPEVIEVCRRHGARTVMYAHASVGVIHVRPLIDLKSPVGVQAYRSISEEVFELVVKYGGSWSGEHGDGLIRSYQNRRLFGDRLYEAFMDVKRAFDPDWLMNPGKVVEAPPLTEDLRYGPDYPEVSVATHFDFSDQEGFLGAVEACTGVGACRKVGVGTMCPSYMATRDEDHSTRGRANVLREAITGGLPGGLTSRAVYEVLDLCLECKACKAECPSQVDMAKLKYEWLQHYHDEHGVSLPTLAFANVGRVAPLGQALAPVANALLPLRPVRWLMEKTVGVDARRVLPRYAPERFERWFARRRAQKDGPAGGAPAHDPAPGGANPTAVPAHAAASGPNGRRVALFVDTWTRYNEQGPGKAAVAVLEALGYDVELVPYGCCGRPQVSKGLVRRAQRMAADNVAKLKRYGDEGVPVLGLEPSCVAAFRDDYPDLVPGEATESVAANVRLVEEFLAKEWTSGRLKPEQAFRRVKGPLLFHGHCQQKAVLGTSYASAVLGWVADDVQVLDAGCCGMAGSFGYAHHEVSMAIGEQRLFPAVRSHDGVTAAPGFSCRHQIADGTGKRAVHPVEVLAERLRQPARAPVAAPIRDV